MDAEEQAQLDADFESMLDAALGIECTSASQAAAPTTAYQDSSRPHGPHHFIIGSPVVYDQPSPSTSPTSSPVHCPHASPCMSSTSNQMHAMWLPDHNSSYPGLYSPVRESGSPPPDQYSPTREEPAAAAAESHLSASEPQQPVQQQHTSNSQSQQLDQQQPATREILLQQSQHLQLCALPREVQMRILCFLSADALVNLGSCSRQLHVLCNEPVLWRRLFVHRWGRKVVQNNNQSWKARYLERDGVELRAAGAAALDPSDGMQRMFVQAMVAKRQQALGRAAVDDLMLVADDEIAAKVAQWRKSRGFEAGSETSAAAVRPDDITQHLSAKGAGHRQSVIRTAGFKPPGVVKRRAAAVHQQKEDTDFSMHHTGRSKEPSASQRPDQQSMVAAAGLSASNQAMAHDDKSAGEAGMAGQNSTNTAAAAAQHPEPAAKRPRRRWTQFGNVFCDETSGWIHVCDETCSEKIVEPSSGLLVCPISGAVSDRMMTCAEEEAEEGPREAEGGGVGQTEEDYGGEKGRLARAFAAGYYCSDEKELLRTCGVRLSR